MLEKGTGLRVLAVAIIAGLLMTSGAVARDYWAFVPDDGAISIKEGAAAASPGLVVDDHGVEGFVVRATIPGIRLAPMTVRNGDTFVVVDWPNTQATGEIGQPQLPVIRRLFIAPAGARVTITLREGDPTTIGKDAAGFPLLVMPCQAPVEKIPGAIEAAPFDYDANAYAVNESLPAERYVVKELGMVRGQRLFMLELRPVAYNPTSQTLTYWPDLDAEVTFSGGEAAVAAPSGLPGLDRAVLNPSVMPAAKRGFGNYLIIVANTFESAIGAFADAKEDQGFTVSIHAVAPGTSNTVIKSHIQSLWGTAAAPDYVLLVGDTESIPHWDGQGEGSPDTDLQYGCMDGPSDWYPDLAVGRFPVDDLAELQVMIEKTLYYENGPLADPGYIKRSVFMASVDNYEISEGTHNYVIDHYMAPFGYEYDRLYSVTYDATTQDVRDSFNDGRFYGVYSGHGGTYSWADGPPFEQSDVTALTNDNMYALVCSFACITGTYTVDECFMETWVLSPHKGAVTAWGSSVNSYWNEDDILERVLFDAIFDNGDTVPTEVGPIYTETKLRYLAHYGDTATTRRYLEMYNLLGDPGLRMPSACSDAGEIKLDSQKYGCASTATVEVTDCGLNLDDGVVDTVAVTIASTSETGGESLVLIETDAASAQFTGAIALSATGGTGALRVAEGDTLTATYIDADDGQGGIDVAVTATALVDCTPPTIDNVHTTNVEPRSAVVYFDANELVKGTARYGLSCAALTGTAASGAYALSPAINITGLIDDTTYFYAVDAEDQAGNMSSDDGGGACYSFTTPEVPEFFTELFSDDDNDLDNISLNFIPNGSVDHYVMCGYPLTALPTDPAGGEVFAFDDDDYATVTLTGGASVSLYGTTYTKFYPCSNGYITFESGEANTSEELDDHFAQPRISALFDDLNPSSGGTVSWKQFSDRVAVTWDGVHEYSTGVPNTFQIVMYFDGRIELNYLSIGIEDGLAGLSAGEGLDPDFYESDLSAAGSCGPRPPLAQDMDVATPVATAVEFELAATDDGLPDPPAALTYYVMSLPSKTLRDAGNDHVILASDLPYTLSGGARALRYTPPAGYIGVDSFTFKVNDGGEAPEGGDSNIATVSIMVGGPEVVHYFPMDENPGWETEGQWAFGQPTGGSGSSGDPDPTSGHTGNYVYGYNLAGGYVDDMDCYYLTSAAMDCTDLTRVELRFWRWLGIESDSYDHANIDVSVDGATWTTIWEHDSGSFTDPGWIQVAYDISAIADGQPTVYLRWGMGETDGSVTYCGWNIDDVEIWGIPAMEDCVTAAHCPQADVNCDNVSDGFDIAVVRNSANWLKGAGECAEPRADVNADGTVDGFDIAVIRNSQCWLR